jgi:hypothetical protein
MPGVEMRVAVIVDVHGERDPKKRLIVGTTPMFAKCLVVSRFRNATAVRAPPRNGGKPTDPLDLMCASDCDEGGRPGVVMA